MVTAFLDTVIVVDIIRNHPPAVEWYLLQGNDPNISLGISSFVWMETISGGRNKLLRSRIAKSLQVFEMVYPTREDIDWAHDAQLQYQLSYGVGILDCLIASPSVRLNIPLYTRNLKHFSPLLNTLAVQPY